MRKKIDEPKFYSQYAVKFMIAEGIYKFISEIDFSTGKFPQGSLCKVAEEVIESFDKCGDKDDKN